MANDLDKRIYDKSLLDDPEFVKELKKAMDEVDKDPKIRAMEDRLEQSQMITAKDLNIVINAKG